MQQGRLRRGFTLIELMITVAIIGILAAMAMTNFMRIQLRSKISEAKVNLASVRTAQLAYGSVAGTFLPAVPSPVPDALLGSSKQAWVDNGGFDAMGWTPEGDVYFNYRVTAAPGGCPAPGNPCTSFTIEAASDLDANGALNFWGYVYDDPAGGAPAGVSCVPTGVYNPDSGFQDALRRVGPCTVQMGRLVY